MLNFKSVRSAGSVLAGVERMHMIRKAQFTVHAADAMSFATNFMRWQHRSIQFEAPQFLSWKIPSLDQQGDTTI